MLAYRRSVGAFAGVSVPFVSDVASGAVSGLLTRRLSFSISGGYSHGNAVGLTPNRFDALNASTRLSYTATRYVPVYAEYVYYWYRFERPLGLAPGFPILVDRHGLRAGLAYSVPLVGRRRIQQ